MPRPLVWALVAAAWSAPASAHTGEVRRQLSVEPAGETIQVLVELHITGKKRQRALAMLADQDRDGVLSKPERGALERILVARALDGVRLIVGSSTVTLDNAKSALSVEGNRPRALMVLGTAPLPPKVDRLAVRTSIGGDPMVVRTRAGTRPVTEVSRGRVIRGAFEVAMGVQDRISWRIAAPR